VKWYDFYPTRCVFSIPSPRLADRKHTIRWIKIISHHKTWEILYIQNISHWYLQKRMYVWKNNKLYVLKNIQKFLFILYCYKCCLLKSSLTISKRFFLRTLYCVIVLSHLRHFIIEVHLYIRITITFDPTSKSGKK
jgi:hypothetical protein